MTSTLTPATGYGLAVLCEGIWVGTLRRERPCRNLAACKVNAEWLCAEHAEDIPTPDQMDYRDCADCRADRGMPHRSGFPGAYYWCPGCNTEWREPGRYPDMYRTHPLDLAFGILRVLYTLALFVVFTGLAILWLEPDYPHVSEGQRLLAGWGGAGMALIPTIAASALINEILYWGARSLAWAARYVLGGPIVKGGQSQ